MKTKPATFVPILLWIGACLCIEGAEPKAESTPTALPPAGVVFEKDIVYGKAGEVELLLNLARPAQNNGPVPLVVVIHGGGWAAGNRSQHDDLTWKIAQRGCVSATISYRFAPQYMFPAQVEDAKCAVRFLRAHAVKYQIDPSRIGAMGFSAGAHLAMMLGTMDNADGLEGVGGWPDQSSKVQAVVSFVGPTDLAAEDFGEVSRGILKNFVGGTREEKLELCRRASPIAYVNPGDAAMLLFQGTRDPLIPNTQAFKMAEALTTAGVKGRVELLLGAGHGWGSAEMERTLNETFRFFDSALRK
jgi:acetyl esterase/lipase